MFQNRTGFSSILHIFNLYYHRTTVLCKYYVILYLPSQIIGAMPLSDSTVMFLDEEFSGRVDNLTQVMGLHPHYLQAFLRCHYYLLRMDGPLPLHYRHYIAIMVQTHTETLSR